ncbi:hypothetical protein C1I99_10575 [Micromonospora deserti]|uniref:Uncharacterized protein n=1 Tax=Micromonospora deserti TaxID=2070366 RepID=A0A2W2D7X7_9ACTN|nr:hypothetical protein C1I99_10575 [Micromonospora deserti]
MLDGLAEGCVDAEEEDGSERCPEEAEQPKIAPAATTTTILQAAAQPRLTVTGFPMPAPSS